VSVVYVDDMLENGALHGALRAEPYGRAR